MMIMIIMIDNDNYDDIIVTIMTKGRVHKKNPEKMWSFAKLGGISDGSKMPNFYFGKVFFQLACRIILGPPKHVLHLV